MRDEPDLGARNERAVEIHGSNEGARRDITLRETRRVMKPAAIDCSRRPPQRSSRANRLDVSQRLPPIFCTSA
jgi:hypothetical protein